MISKNQAILGLISLVVIASGCTQGGNSSDVTTTQTKAITVQSFSVFPNPMLSGSTGDLTLRIQNTGGGTATDVSATVYNVPWHGDSSGGELEWGYSGVEGSSPPNNPVLEFGTLTGPDPQRNIPSTAREESMEVTAPSAESGLDSEYEFFTDIVFNYNTTAEATVTVMGMERYTDERPTRSRPTVENTGGPIQVDIRTESPIIIRDSGGSKQVCFIVNNVGGGTPYLPDEVSEEGEDKVELSVRIPNADVEVQNREVDVSRDTNSGGLCTDIGSDFGDTPDRQQSFPIEASARYTYEKTERTSVQVEETG